MKSTSLKTQIFALGIASAILVSNAWAGPNWAQWRGPNLNGSSPAKNLPVSWSKTENVKWATPMPGASGATPIIWGDRIFLTSLDNSNFDLVAMCLDRNTGEVLWKKTLGIGSSDEGRGKNLASPSPVTDGDKVIFSFGTGDIAALDFEGNIIWQKNHQTDYERFQYNFGYHASPLLHKGKLYVQVLQRDRGNPGPTREESHPEYSYILCMDANTGAYLWKHNRPSEAWDETRESYSTPMPYTHNDREEILIFGGDCISGHDPETGKEYWRWGTWNPERIGHWRVVPSPVTFEDLIYVCAPKQEPVFAVKAGGVGELSDEWVQWSFKNKTTDVAVPLIYKGWMYVLDGDGRFVTKLNPKTGEEIWQGRIGGRAVYRASPTGADDKIYMINEQGHVVVLDTGDEFKVLFEIDMGEGLCRSTISATDNQIFIRTAENLYCIGE